MCVKTFARIFIVLVSYIYIISTLHPCFAIAQSKADNQNAAEPHSTSAKGHDSSSNKVKALLKGVARLKNSREGRIKLKECLKLLKESKREEAIKCMQKAIQESNKDGSLSLPSSKEIKQAEGEQKLFSRMKNCFNFQKDKDYEGALECWEKSLESARKINSPKACLLATFALASSHMGLKNYEKSLKFFDEAIKYANTLRDDVREASLKADKAAVYLQMNKPKESIELINKALPVLKKNSPALSAFALSTLARAQSSLNDNDSAVKNLQEKERILLREKNTEGLGDTYTQLGHVKEDLGNFDEAEDYHLEALKNYQDVQKKKKIGWALSNLGYVKYEKKQYKESLAYYVQALAIDKDLQDIQSEASTYSSIGRVQEKKGEYEKAKDYYLKALKVRQSENKVSKDLFSTLDDIGDIYKKQSLFNKSIEYYEKALKVAEELKNPKLKYQALYELMFMHGIQGQVEKVSQLVEQAKIAAKETGESKLETEIETFSLAQKLSAGIMDFPAESVLELADNLKAIQNKDYEYYARMLAANKLFFEVEFNQSIAQATRAFEIADELNDTIKKTGAAILRAHLRQKLGRYEDAEKDFLLALELSEDFDLENKYLRSVIFTGLADLEQGRGNINKAISYRNRAIDNSGNNIMSSFSYTYRAWTYRILGKYEMAIADYDEAYKKAKDLPVQRIKVSNDRGVTYQEQGKLERALTSYKIALKAAEEISSDKSVENGRASINSYHKIDPLVNIAKVYFAMGDRDQGIKELEEAQKISDLYQTHETSGFLKYHTYLSQDSASAGPLNTSSKINPMGLISFLNEAKTISPRERKLMIARVYIKAGVVPEEDIIKNINGTVEEAQIYFLRKEYEKAYGTLSNIYNSSNKNRVKNPQAMFRVCYWLGVTSKALGKIDEAENFWEEAVDRVEDIRNNTSAYSYLDFMTGETEGDKYSDAYYKLVECQYTQEKYKKAVRSAELLRARMFSQRLLQRLAADQAESLPASFKKYFGSLKELEEAFMNIERKDSPQKDQADKQKKIEDLKRKQIELREQMVRDDPKLYGLLFPSSKYLVEYDIPRNQRILFYHLGPKGIYSFFIFKDNTNILKIKANFSAFKDMKLNGFKKEPLVLSDFEYAVEKYVDSMAYANPKNLWNRFGFLRKIDLELSNDLYMVLLKPWEEYLGIKESGKNNNHNSPGKLIIVPHRALGALPFSTLAMKEGGEVSKCPLMPELFNTFYIKGTDFFGDHFDVAYQQSLASMTINKMRNHENGSDRILLVTNPDTGSCEDKFPNIPRPKSIIEYFEDEFKDTSDMFEGAEATKSKYEEEIRSTKKYKWIVIIAHGDYRSSGITEPSLILACSKKGGVNNNGNRLTMSDVIKLNLDADLVFLVACNTARGKLRPGEGIMSMGRAFMAAGAKTVVMTVNPVEAGTATKISENFFKHLSKGVKPYLALKKAKASLQEEKPYIDPHPTYWGPYVIYGDAGF